MLKCYRQKKRERHRTVDLTHFCRHSTAAAAFVVLRLDIVVGCANGMVMCDGAAAATRIHISQTCKLVGLTKCVCRIKEIRSQPTPYRKITKEMKKAIPHKFHNHHHHPYRIEINDKKIKI